MRLSESFWVRYFSVVYSKVWFNTPSDLRSALCSAEAHSSRCFFAMRLLALHGSYRRRKRQVVCRRLRACPLFGKNDERPPVRKLHLAA